MKILAITAEQQTCLMKPIEENSGSTKNIFAIMNLNFEQKKNHVSFLPISFFTLILLFHIIYLSTLSPSFNSFQKK